MLNSDLFAFSAQLGGYKIALRIFIRKQDFKRLVVVRTAVPHAIFRIIFGLMLAVRVAVKAERHNFHPGIARVFHQFPHAVVDNAEILGNDGRVKKMFEKPHLRSVCPLAVFRRRFAVFDTVVPVETPEMVEPNDIVNGKAVIYPAAPPGVIVKLHFLPIVNGVAPKLPVGRKSVGRNARNVFRLAVAVKQKQFASVFPNLNAVVRHVNRDVAENFNAPFRGVIFKLEPLRFAKKLSEQPELVFLAISVQKAGYKSIIVGFILSPVRLVAVRKFLFQSHKKRVIVVIALPAKLLPGTVFLIESGKSFFQNFCFLTEKKPVIDPSRVASEIDGGQLVRSQ